MSWPYIHVTINHFPIILMVVGCAVLILALIRKSRPMLLYAVASLTLAGVGAYPAFFSGHQAEDVLEHTWYVERAAVHEHDEAADFALVALLMTGAAAAYTWWRMVRREPTTLPPVWLRAVLTVVALWTLSVVVRTAYLGGKIVHEAPLLEHPPGGR